MSGPTMIGYLNWPSGQSNAIYWNSDSFTFGNYYNPYEWEFGPEEIQTLAPLMIHSEIVFARSAADWEMKLRFGSLRSGGRATSRKWSNVWTNRKELLDDPLLLLKPLTAARAVWKAREIKLTCLESKVLFALWNYRDQEGDDAPQIHNERAFGAAERCLNELEPLERPDNRGQTARLKRTSFTAIRNQRERYGCIELKNGKWHLCEEVEDWGPNQALHEPLGHAPACSVWN